jgi:hypothetical protein
MSSLDRLLLLATGLLAAYQVAVGIEGAPPLAVWAYTVGFGVLLVAGLLLIIMGFEVLESSPVVIVATVIPLALSLGLVWEHMPARGAAYLVFVALGFVTVTITRLALPGRAATVFLALVHGVAGLLIFGLPIWLSLRGETPAGFALVGLGGALIGVGGLLLSFLKMGRPVLSQNTILAVLPGLLLMMAAAFVAGFALA